MLRIQLELELTSVTEIGVQFRTPTFCVFGLTFPCSVFIEAFYAALSVVDASYFCVCVCVVWWNVDENC